MNWQGLPYYPINQFYKAFFKEKVYKVPVSVAESCPNREGLRGMKACIFCDEWGSFAYPENQKEELDLQIKKHKEIVKKRVNSKKFLIYFQAYTNSFLKVARLKEAFGVARRHDDVCGLVVGTRPDCLSHGVLDLWNELAQDLPVFVEIGVQSFNKDHLKWLQRGHDREKSLWAFQRIQNHCPEINLGAHLIFGLPGETDDDLKEAAHLCSHWKLNNVKLHNLHVLKNTPLEEMFHKGEFQPLEFQEYARKVKVFLQHLDPSIAVHRLTAGVSRMENLVSPQWVGDKMKSYQSMIDYLKLHKAYQGQYC